MIRSFRWAYDEPSSVTLSAVNAVWYRRVRWRWTTVDLINNNNHSEWWLNWNWPHGARRLWPHLITASIFWHISKINRIKHKFGWISFWIGRVRFRCHLSTRFPWSLTATVDSDDVYTIWKMPTTTTNNRNDTDETEIHGTEFNSVACESRTASVLWRVMCAQS